jgi:hypothetical protein
MSTVRSRNVHRLSLGDSRGYGSLHGGDNSDWEKNEAFYVLDGSMRGFCGDQEWRACRGAFVWLPRGIPHGYAVEGDEPLRTLAFAIPAGFDEFVIETGEPASTRTVPPPGAPNVERMTVAAAKAGIETLEPPEI